MLAVVTEESIPESYNKSDQVITHQEEYALTLEKRLIQKFKRELHDIRLCNEGTDPGKTDNEASIAYVIYMAFELNDECPIYLHTLWSMNLG